jgi:hypothetical protein
MGISEVGFLISRSGPILIQLPGLALFECAAAASGVEAFAPFSFDDPKN